MEYTKNHISSIISIILLVIVFFLPADFVISWTIPSSPNSLRRYFTRRITRTKNVVRFPAPYAENATYVHNHFMEMAIEQANKAGEKGEVPIGAVIVKRQQDDDGGGGGGSMHTTYHVISRGYNMVETTQDASAHAEMQALRRAAKKIQNWRLLNMTLYCTLEPCPICLSAIQQFRIQTLVYGAPQVRYGAVESHMRMLDDYQHPSHTIEEVVSGVMKEECADILKSFFRRRRKERPKVPKASSGYNNAVQKPTFASRFNRIIRWPKIK
jgi:tRNA(adenine34) deaminase